MCNFNDKVCNILADGELEEVHRLLDNMGIDYNNKTLFEVFSKIGMKWFK